MYDLDLNGSDLGLLVAVFALFQMIASPFGGRFADKFGKKIIIIIGDGGDGPGQASHMEVGRLQPQGMIP